MEEENEVVEEQTSITFEEEVEEVEPQEETEEPQEEPEKGKVEFSPEQQEKLNEIIANRTRVTYQERERADKLEQELAQLRQKLPEEQRPEVPPMPDPYDKDYESKVSERDKVIQEQAQYDARTAQETQRQLEYQQQLAQQQQQRVINTVQEYSQRAEQLGIKPEELQQAGGAVQQYGLNDEISFHILSEPLGPQITLHLANNPQDAAALASMTPTQAAIYIENTIKPNVQPRKVEPTPDPPEHIKGKGAVEKERGPKGATFE